MGIENIDALIQQSVVESHDEEDVPAALDRTTQDGSGFEDWANPQIENLLPPSDFEENE